MVLRKYGLKKRRRRRIPSLSALLKEEQNQITKPIL
jgi:hypothetical protein